MYALQGMKELVNVYMIDVQASKVIKDNVGFGMNFDDAIAHSLNATTKSMEKCKRRYNTILKKSTITKESMAEYRKYCKKNGLRVTNMTEFFRKKGMLVESKPKVCDKSDLFERAKKRAMRAANGVAS